MALGRPRHRGQETGGCHSPVQKSANGLPLVAIVGAPNVGKSLLFHRLTGVYAAVSNYPGTTVEVARGRLRRCGCGAELVVVDTPGMYSLTPLTEEERIARRILLEERPPVVLHVVDAKNLSRMLPLTLQLAEAGFAVILVVNLIDEAERLGMRLDLAGLERALGLPVRGTVCTTGEGIELLRRTLEDHVRPQPALRFAD